MQASPTPVGQRLVARSRLDRARSARDRRPTVDRRPASCRGRHACHGHVANASQRPCHQSIHRHHAWGHGGRGGALGGRCDGTAGYWGLMSPFSSIRWGRSGAEGATIWPLVAVAKAGQNRWSAVVSRKPRGHHRHRPRPANTSPTRKTPLVRSTAMTVAGHFYKADQYGNSCSGSTSRRLSATRRRFGTTPGMPEVFTTRRKPHTTLKRTAVETIPAGAT